MVRFPKRVMRKLRYLYCMEATEVGKFTIEQEITEQNLQELLEWQKGKGQRVRILEGKTKEGKKWIKGIPCRSKRVNAMSEEESEEEPTGKEEKEIKDKGQQEEDGWNSWHGCQDWSKWKKPEEEGGKEQLKREGERKSMDETESSNRGKKRSRSSYP